MRRFRCLVVVLALLAAACDGFTPTTTPTDGGTAPTTPGLSTSTSSTVSAAPTGCEGEPESYTEDGPLGILGTPDADAQLITGIRLVDRGECERMEVVVSTGGGAPATNLPVTEIEMLSDSGIMRITFATGVEASAITDSILEGDLIERAYVVRGLDGSIFIDAHVSSAVAARAFVIDSPVRVAVELRPIAGDPPQFPKLGGFVVVTGPTAGSIEYPIVVTGYARTFEANVVARLFSEAGTETEVNTTAADYLELWGQFEITIEEGPGGDVTIFVGEDSPEDGSPIGVEFQFSAG